jgi:WD40 repeat protein
MQPVRYRWPLLRWAMFALLLGAIAAGLYVMLPPEPRWVLPCNSQWVFRTADGHIATYGSIDGTASGPLLVWDVGTGRELARFLTDGEPMQARSRSDDGRYFVATVKDDPPGVWRLRGVDLESQREWHTDVAPGPFRSAIFSPRGDFVALQMKRVGNVGAHNLIVATGTGRTVGQLPGDAEQVLFGGDGGCVAATYREENSPSQIRILSTRTGKTTVIDGAGLLAVSPDSRWVIAERGEEGVWLWDVAGACWHAPLPELQAPPPHYSLTDLVIGDGWAHLATRYYHRQALWAGLHLRAASRRRVRLIDYAVADLWRGSSDNWTFSPDSRFLLCAEHGTGRGNAGPLRWTLYDVDSGKRLWTREWRDNTADHHFTPDSRRMVVLLSRTGKVEVVDAATGVTERTIELTGMESPSVRLTRDGRTAVVIATAPDPGERPWLIAKISDWIGLSEDGTPMVIRAFDVETGATVGELHTAECDDHWLTDDRKSLVTVCADNDDDGATGTTICCWDVPAKKPLRWVFGAPACLGVALVLLRFGWRRLRHWRAARKASRKLAGAGSGSSVTSPCTSPR